MIAPVLLAQITVLMAMRSVLSSPPAHLHTAHSASITMKASPLMDAAIAIKNHSSQQRLSSDMLESLSSMSTYIIVASLSIPMSTVTPFVLEVFRSTMSVFLSISEGSLEILSLSTSQNCSTVVTTRLTANSTAPMNTSSLYNALSDDIDGESMAAVLADALSHSPAALLNATLAQQFSRLSLTIVSVQCLSYAPTMAPTITAFAISSFAMDHALAPQSIALILIFSIIGVCIFVGLAFYSSHELSKNRRVSIEPLVHQNTEDRQIPAA